MRSQLEQRLQVLKAEFEAGQQMLTDHEIKTATLKETLLRISGAIQVLEEELAPANPAGEAPSPASEEETGASISGVRVLCSRHGGFRALLLAGAAAAEGTDRGPGFPDTGMVSLASGEVHHRRRAAPARDEYPRRRRVGFPARGIAALTAVATWKHEGRRVMSHLDMRDALVASWQTNNRVTTYLLENLPSALWAESVPGAPRRTVRMIAGHIHNCRCTWIKTLGREHGIAVPKSVDRHRVTRAQLIPALKRSSRGIIRVLDLGIEHGGKIPGFPANVVRFLAYHVAHEGHHRGQICMLARQLGHRLPAEVTNGLWQWSKRANEAQSSG